MNRNDDFGLIMTIRLRYTPRRPNDFMFICPKKENFKYKNTKT